MRGAEVVPVRGAVGEVLMGKKAKLERPFFASLLAGRVAHYMFTKAIRSRQQRKRVNPFGPSGVSTDRLFRCLHF